MRGRAAGAQLDKESTWARNYTSEISATKWTVPAERDVLRVDGTVDSANVIADRETGRSKGFGFVEMSSDAEMQAAIAALNGQDSGGRTMTVAEAKPRERHDGTVCAGNRS